MGRALKVFAGLWAVLVVAGCTTLPHQVKGFSIPPLEIVFQTQGFPYTSDSTLGFVSADGSQVVRESTAPLSPIFEPAWRSDGKAILFTDSYTHILSLVQEDGRILTWPHIHGAGRVISVGEGEVLVKGFDDGSRPWFYLQRVTLDKGEVVRTYLAAPFWSVGTRPLEGAWLVYSQWWYANKKASRPAVAQLILLNLETGEKKTLLQVKQKWLMNPSFSPDGRWIAYVSTDGLYRIPIDGGLPQRLTALRHYWGTAFHTWPPNFAWSPDGHYIVYHQCVRKDGACTTEVKDYALFVLDLNTGEERLLVRGGVNPDWRPPIVTQGR